MLTDERDPGTLGYVVSLKRTDGGLPKLVKCFGDGAYAAIYHEPNRPEELVTDPHVATSYEVRPVIVYFADPDAEPIQGEYRELRVSYKGTGSIVIVPRPTADEPDLCGFIATTKQAESFLTRHSAKQADSRIVRSLFGLTYYATEVEFLPVIKERGLSFYHAFV
jgi:hypothetical protein